MRLIQNLDKNKINSQNILILIRHGIDENTLTEDLNQPLIEETKPDIEVLGLEIIDFCRTNNIDKLNLRYSNRLRAQQTAEILANKFHSRKVNFSLIETEGVREVYQGRFIIKNHTNGNEYKPLVDAWTAWQKKLDACELQYKFGDPVVSNSGSVEFPSLIGWFKEYGEHQGDFSLRLYLMMKEVFDTEGNNATHIIVGHQASCSRIQRILNAASKLKSVTEFKSGEFVKYLEKNGSRLTIQPACGIVTFKPDKHLMIDILSKEIDYLHSII